MIKLKKLLKANKAISPILATLLLVIIAVAAIVMTYAWITTYVGNTTSQAGVMPYKANVNFKGNGVITVDIGNSGTSNTEILQVYIGTSATNATSQTTNPAIPIRLNAGEIASLNVQYAWATGKTYYFKVATASGQPPLTFQEQAPE
jgi:flagellin-like protein